MYQKQSVKKIEFGNCVLKSAKNWPEFQIYQSKIVPNLQIRTNIAIISWNISNLMKTRVKLEFKSESWGFCRVRTKSEINEWGRVSRSGKTRKFSGFEWSSRLKLEWGWGQSSLVGFLAGNGPKSAIRSSIECYYFACDTGMCHLFPWRSTVGLRSRSLSSEHGSTSQGVPLRVPLRLGIELRVVRSAACRSKDDTTPSDESESGSSKGTPFWGW